MNADDPAARPILAAMARLRDDRRSGRKMLLSPERGLTLNASAAAIVTRCTGQYSTAEIIDSLARDSTAPRATIAEVPRIHDVAAIRSGSERCGLSQRRRAAVDGGEVAN